MSAAATAAREDGARGGYSVLIPAYNEEGAIAATLDGVAEVLAETAAPSEIVVVDDGSTDATAARAGASHARLVKHDGNRGYGAALKTGLREARYDRVCIIDADGTYAPACLGRLLRADETESADMLVGARTGAKVHIPWVRRPAKWVIGRLANLVAGRAIPDINSGLRVIDRDAALSFLPLLPDGFSFTTTITLAMLKSGFRVRYLPIDYHPRTGRSKIRPIYDTLNFVRLIFRIALYFAPLKVFLPVSALLMLAGVGWGVFTWAVWGRLADVTTVLLVVSGLQVGMMALLAELIDQRLPDRYRNR